MVKIKLKTGKEIYLDGFLMQRLDTIVYNIHNDWDFVIIITGDRMVRTGKSVLAMNICAYLAERLGVKYDLDDIYFDADRMIKEARKKPRFSINHLDEAGTELGKTTVLRKVQDNLVNYFEQCGQLNQVFVLVLPDFFRLREDIAVARSEYLINVYRKDEMKEVDLYGDGTKRKVSSFNRGRFEFFDRNKKRLLYDKAQSMRRKNYGLVKANQFGTFTKNHPLDDLAYRQKKLDYLKKLEKVQKQENKTHTRMRETIVKVIKYFQIYRKGTLVHETLKKEEEFPISLRTTQRIIKTYLETPMPKGHVVNLNSTRRAEFDEGEIEEPTPSDTKMMKEELLKAKT